MSSYPPQPPGGYPPPNPPGYGPPPGGQPGPGPGSGSGSGYSGAPPPPYPGGAVPPYQQYQAPLPGQAGYQWGAGVPAYPYAGFGSRFGSVLLDGLIVSAIAAIPVIVGIVLIGSSVSTSTNSFTGTSSSTVTNGGTLAFGILIIIVGWIFALLYEPLMTGRHGIHNGQTLGKQAVNIRITNLQGGPITKGQAWGRFLFKAFFSGSVFYLGYLWVLWDANKQGWHDKVANTLVLSA